MFLICFSNRNVFTNVSIISEGSFDPALFLKHLSLVSSNTAPTALNTSSPTGFFGPPKCSPIYLKRFSAFLRILLYFYSFSISSKMFVLLSVWMFVLLKQMSTIFQVLFQRSQNLITFPSSAPLCHRPSLSWEPQYCQEPRCSYGSLHNQLTLIFDSDCQCNQHLHYPSSYSFH